MSKLKNYEIDIIIEAYKKLKSIQKVSKKTGYSKNTINKYVKNISSLDVRSKDCPNLVEQIDLKSYKIIRTWVKPSVAAKELHIDPSEINRVIKGELKQAGGFKWRYSKIIESTSIDIYEMVLQDRIKRFPKHFWQEISDSELRNLLKYFFEIKLKWTIEDIKNKLDTYVFYKYKLAGAFFIIFNGSPFNVVDFTYPKILEEWELKSTPLNYWTKDKCVAVIKRIIEKEKWTENDMRNKSIYELFSKYGLTTIVGRFSEGDKFNLINIIYPNKFKPWELHRSPNNYWNIETGKEAIRWMIEEKEKWTESDIKEKYCYNIFKKYKLEKMLATVFDCSPFKAINETYPGKFKKEDFVHIKNKRK